MVRDRLSPSALVVEGGAMRGIFAAGALDGFHERRYRPFDFCIGVSAGATNLASWLAGQHSRAFTVITDHSWRPEFINFRRFLRGGHALDLDWMFEICLKEIPLDQQALFAQATPLIVVTTCVETGQPVYTHVTLENVERLLKATCAVPLAYRHSPELKGVAMADGGVADSIPVVEAYNRGVRHITVVLSQASGHRMASFKAPWLIRRAMARTPALAEAILRRSVRYNEAMDFLQKPPEDCQVRIIAPPIEFGVKRFTKNLSRLEAGYRMGKEAAEVYYHEQMEVNVSSGYKRAG